MTTVAEQHYEQKSPTYGISHTRRDRILKLATGSGRRVLDVACSRGYLGKLIKDRGNYVVGADISQSAADMARQVLDDVYVFDIQSDWPAVLQKGDFNLIILGAIIEHIFDPVQLMKKVSAALKPDGAAIVTTPNFFSWRNRLRFLFGQFRYTEQGDFDFGHIRWFNYRYFKEVLDEAGFKIYKENHYYFPGKLTRVLKYWPSLFATHFVIKAVKKT